MKANFGKPNSFWLNPKQLPHPSVVSILQVMEGWWPGREENLNIDQGGEKWSVTSVLQSQNVTAL